MGKNKVVLHSDKGGSNVGGFGHHIDRTNGKEWSYRQADPTKKHLNVNFARNKYQKMSLQFAIDNRIKDGYKAKRKIRKDAQRFVKHILSGSHEKMKEIFADERLKNEWLEANYKFMADEFGAENIVRFNLHLDEKTPHVHCVIVPITKDGRLSCKEVNGNKTVMSERQTRYAQAMSKFGLERGVKGTGIKHEDAQTYYARIEKTNEVLKESAKINESVGRAPIITDTPPVIGRAKWVEEQNKKILNEFEKLRGEFQNIAFHKVEAIKNKAVSVTESYLSEKNELVAEVVALKKENKEVSIKAENKVLQNLKHQKESIALKLEAVQEEKLRNEKMVADIKELMKEELNKQSKEYQAEISKLEKENKELNKAIKTLEEQLENLGKNKGRKI